MRHSLLAIVLLTACLTSASADDGPLRVLFIGNSLTYYNDLPFMVATMSEHGDKKIKAGMIAMPNAGLEDLWRDGRVRQQLATGEWDVLVMQQGPSSLMSSRKNLVEWSGRFATLARESGTEPALYTVWPSSARRVYLPDVIESYRVAAESCECKLLAAGAAWKKAWEKSSRLSLYGADGFHPSDDGTYLAALVIWHGLTGESPAAVPDRLTLENGEKVRIKAKRAEVYRDVVRALEE